MKPTPKNDKHPEYLQLAQQRFCERYGVLAPHEAIDRRLATITDWCQHIDQFRSLTPRQAPKRETSSDTESVLDDVR
jgi:hypothetical protein